MKVTEVEFRIWFNKNYGENAEYRQRNTDIELISIQFANAIVKKLTIPAVGVPKGTFTANDVTLPKEPKPINRNTNSGKQITKKP